MTKSSVTTQFSSLIVGGVLTQVSVTVNAEVRFHSASSINS